MISGSAYRLGFHWVDWVILMASAVTSGAVLRFAGRAFLRWGPPAEEFASPGERIRDKPHTQGGKNHTPAAMYAPAAALVILGALFGLSPRLTGTAEASAIHVQDRAAYAQVVLDMLRPYPPTVHDLPATAGDVGRSLGTGVAAALLAAVTLLSPRTRRAFGRSRAANLVVRSLGSMHRGTISNYLTWMMAGTAVFGAAAFIWMR
jgi:hypothetical protein